MSLAAAVDRRVALAMRPLAERFLDKVPRGLPDDACWPWLGERAGKGSYGLVRVSPLGESPKRRSPASRVAWVLAHGPIADELFVCHRCDNPPCVNVAHLFLGTSLDNNADKLAKGRQAHGDRLAASIRRAALRGNACPNSKLTQEQVDRVRAAYAARTGRYWGLQKLATEFGVAEQTICSVLSGRTWRGEADGAR